jgi:hypothetical protein
MRRNRFNTECPVSDDSGCSLRNPCRSALPTSETIAVRSAIDRPRPQGDIRADVAKVRCDPFSEYSVGRANSCSPPL